MLSYPLVSTCLPADHSLPSLTPKGIALSFFFPGVEAIEVRTFMHLMATYFPFLMDCALSTSENVPSPFFATSRYLCMLAAYVQAATGRCWCCSPAAVATQVARFCACTQVSAAAAM